jgi:hypothetical protein
MEGLFRIDGFKNRRFSALMADKRGPMDIFYDLTIRMPKVSSAIVGRVLTRERTEPVHEESQVEIPHGLVPVRVVAPIPLRKAVYRCALYFRRELGYDLVQYAIHEDDWYSRAFLWVSCPEIADKHNVWGACCFRWREYTNADPLWAMQWVWLHPYARNHGLLTKAWPYFLARFGWFDVEQPYSHTMRYALRKVGWSRPFIRGEGHECMRPYSPDEIDGEREADT